MEWKSKIKDACCADELEEKMIDNIKAGFRSDDEICVDCEEYISDFYREERGNITKHELLTIIGALRKEYQNTGSQENFLKLDAAFWALKKRGVVALHNAGYTQSEGFEDCNGAAFWREKAGEKVVGCCFYTAQDLGHVLHGDTGLLRFSFGNYFEKPTAEEIGQMIADEFKAVGFCVQWDGTADTKIAIENFKWDKYYTDGK